MLQWEFLSHTFLSQIQGLKIYRVTHRKAVILAGANKSSILRKKKKSPTRDENADVNCWVGNVVGDYISIEQKIIKRTANTFQIVISILGEKNRSLIERAGLNRKL